MPHTCRTLRLPACPPARTWAPPVHAVAPAHQRRAIFVEHAPGAGRPSRHHLRQRRPISWSSRVFRLPGSSQPRGAATPCRSRSSGWRAARRRHVHVDPRGIVVQVGVAERPARSPRAGSPRAARRRPARLRVAWLVEGHHAPCRGTGLPARPPLHRQCRHSDARRSRRLHLVRSLRPGSPSSLSRASRRQPIQYASSGPVLPVMLLGDLLRRVEWR